MPLLVVNDNEFSLLAKNITTKDDREKIVNVSWDSLYVKCCCYCLYLWLWML